MNIKKSYVYKNIRKASARTLFTPALPQTFISVAFAVWMFWVMVTHVELFTTWGLLLDIGLLIYAALWSAALYPSLIAFISPEKSVAATRYAEFVSFEEMCERVETQRLKPIIHLEYWDIYPLEDFIIYKHKKDFFVIPYSAVRRFYSRQTPEKRRFLSEPPMFFVDIDTLSHQYWVVCADREERDEVNRILNEILQKWHEKNSHS